MSVKVHFATLIEVLMTVIEFGMDSASGICVERVRSLRMELKLVVERLNTYLQLHYMLVTPFETKVRNLLVEAINHGMNEGFHELAVQADEFQSNHQNGAPMPGTGDVVQVPKSRTLRKLLESDGMSSLAERAPGWKAAAPAPSAGGEKRKAAQPSGAAKTKAKKNKNTSGVDFPPVMGVQGGVVRRHLPPQRVLVRPRQRHHLYSRPCRTRRRTRSASTAAADSAANPTTAAASSTAALAGATAAGGREGRGSAAKRGQLQHDGWRR